MNKFMVNTRLRRTVGGVCLVVGALLMWLAADAVVPGIVLFAAGIALEVVGITLERRNSTS